MADQNPQQPQTPDVNATVKETDQGVIVETQQHPARSSTCGTRGASSGIPRDTACGRP